jgi:hypothetical protein
MMTHEDMKTIMYEEGRRQAFSLQERSASMTGTELNAEDNVIPEFTAAVKVKNMLEREAGDATGFVCKSSAGRVVRLLQKYDSNNYLHEDGTPWEPEELPAQWRFVWSTDPAKALPFVKMATSPYAVGECCTENGEVFRSKIPANVYAPSEYAQGWEKVEQ